MIAAGYLAAVLFDLTRGGPNFGKILLIYLGYVAWKWGAYGVVRVVLARRVTRALRER